MSLAVVSDIKRLIRDCGALERKIKLGDGTSDDMSLEDVGVYLDRQEDYISRRLKNKGFVITPTDKILIEIHTRLTGYWIYIDMMGLSETGEIPENIKEWKNYALDTLQSILDGEIEISQPSMDLEPRIVLSSRHRFIRNESIKFSGVKWSSMDYQYILKKLERITSDKDWTTTYKKGTDYEIHYQSGEIKRISTGSIPDDTTVYISYWYLETEPFKDVIPSVSYGRRITNL